MKVFDINMYGENPGEDFVAANTAEEALACFRECSDYDHEDDDIKHVRELTSEEMFTKQLCDDPDDGREWPEDANGEPIIPMKSFRATLDEMIARGATFPCYFAGEE